LAQLPFSAFASGIATLLVITFFVTSADSGALVIDMITNGAAEDPPVWQRIFWAVCAGLVAAVLLVAGGLQALQTAAIASALPFAVVMVFMSYGLLRALQTEGKGSSIDLSIAADAPPPERTGMTWQQRLDSITHYHEKSEIVGYLADTACSALNDMADQMHGNGLAPALERHDDRLVLTIPHGEHGAFCYTIRARRFRAPSFAYAETRKTHGTERQHYRAMAHTSEGDQPHDVTGYTRDQLINDVLNRYARFRHTRRLA
jgi:choline/glycine/proline betaine transport protein